MDLTKATVAESIPSQLHFTRIQSVDCVETLLKIMKKTIESGEDVLVSGFGKFRVNPKKEHGGLSRLSGPESFCRLDNILIRFLNDTL